MAQATILIVEDEQELADLFAEWVGGDHTVRTAYSGKQALNHVDEDLDIVLLDRRMPDMPGNRILEEIRDQDLHCRVAMVTAVRPDFDIIEMGFDDYLTKPVSEADLLDTVERLQRRLHYSEEVNEYVSVVSKLAALEVEKAQLEREANDEYLTLVERRAELAESLDTTVNQLNPTDFSVLFHDLSRNRTPAEGAQEPTT